MSEEVLTVKRDCGKDKELKIPIVPRCHRTIGLDEKIDETKIMSEKKEKILEPRKPVSCRPALSHLEKHKSGKPPRYYDAIPRDCQFAYMTPSYYATGFRILDVYKTEVDFSEYRNLTFLEDPKEEHKWGHLRSRIPYPEGRVTDLPGTRELNYKNYCLRSLTPESAMSWRKSIIQSTYMTKENCKQEEGTEIKYACDGK